MTDRRRAAAFLAVVAMELLALGGIIWQRAHLLRSGRPVLLRCQPVDPRSILSGDYVRLRYAISHLSPARLRELNPGREHFRRRQTVHVALEREPDGPAYRAAAVSADRERLRRRWPVVLRGVARSDHDPDWRDSGLEIRFGVEEYFVPQNEGHRIEEHLDRTTVELAVAESGESAIRRLFLDDQEITFY